MRRTVSDARGSLALLRCGVVVSMLLWGWCARVSAADNAAGQWLQWRGPDGAGVSAEANLPVVWDANGTGIAWKTAIEGEGASSPVVCDDKVFVTTAYEDARAGTTQRIASVTMAVLVAVFVVGALARTVSRLRTRRLADDTEPGRSAGQRVKSVLTGALVTVFLVLAVLLFFFPERYDATIGRTLAGLLGNEDTEHVFLAAQDVRPAVWLTTGAVALLGLAAALHWLRAHSIWRLAGGVVFGVLAVAFVVWAPADLWKYPLALKVRLPFALPGAIVAAGYWLEYFNIRIEGEKTTFLRSLNNVVLSWRHPHLFGTGPWTAVLLFACLAGIATLVFVPVNLLLPRMGLQRAVVCLDFQTGAILWQKPVLVAPAERKHRDNSYATPTPATDGKVVVANFGAGVAGLDYHGNVLWTTSDPTYSGNTRYGASSSVLLWQDKAIILREQEENTERITSMAAFDKKTGAVHWRVYPDTVYWAYTTPSLYDDGAGMKLVIASHHNVTCFEADSGKRVWKHDIPMEQIVASMARAGSVFCVGGGTWGPKGLIAMKLSGAGEATKVEELWQSTQHTPGCASPVMYAGMVFTITDTGTMRCYEASSGRLYWTKRLKGRFLASLTAGDGKVYACNTRGVTTVVSADSQFRKLAENPLEGDCRASIAIAGSRIVMRTSTGLYCIEGEAR